MRSNRSRQKWKKKKTKVKIKTSIYFMHKFKLQKLAISTSD